MKFIAHRGNLNGPSDQENKPEYIKSALSLGYDVEVDVWLIGNEIFLGHDNPEYLIDIDFLKLPGLWCHAKNLEALEFLLLNKIHCFWHQDDDFTITSQGFIWTYPRKNLGKNSICVMPELFTDSIPLCFGICTDYVLKFSRNILISMAGKGKRFKEAGYIKSKPLIDIMGKPMIERAVESLGISGNYIFFTQKSDDLQDFLQMLVPGCRVIEIDYITEGPVSTYLLAKEFINNDHPLIITNCDQILEWNANSFLEFAEKTDGCVVTYNTNTDQNSYIEIDSQGNGVRLKEKEVISNHSLNGVHYWKCGKYFVESAEELIKRNIRVNNEFYVSMSFNIMIEKGYKIKNYSLEPNQHFSVGIPLHLQQYLDYKNSVVEIVKMDTMSRGWFIGDFFPSVLRTENFEVGYLKHNKGEKWDIHYHKIITEYNYLISGEMRVNGKLIVAGDIFIFRPGVVADPEFLQDCEIICVKTPSLPKDKIII